MAMNTPDWHQQYQAPTTTLNTTTAKDGVLIVDSTDHALVVMDGVTPGGHRLAKAATKIKAGTPNIKINDTTEGTLGGEITIKVLPGTIPGAVTVATDPAGQPAGKYLDFEYTKADGTAGHYYVNMADFVNIYTKGTGINIVDGKISVNLDEIVDTGPDSLLQVVDGKITLKSVVSTDAGNNLKSGSDGLAYYPADLGTL